MGGDTYGGSGGAGSDGGISDGRPGEGGSGGSGDDGGTAPDDGGGGVDGGGPATDAGAGSGSGSGDGSGSGSGSGDGSGSGSGDGSGSGSGDGSGSGGDGSGSGSGSGDGSGSGSNGCGSDSGSNSGGCGSGSGSGDGSGSGSGDGSGSDGSGDGSDCDYYGDCDGSDGGGGGSGSNSCKPYSVNDPDPDDDQESDVCYWLATGELANEDVSQEVLDICNCRDPEPPTCGFMPFPFFDEDNGGCGVFDESYGYLGNVNQDCPTDVYQEQALCAVMISLSYPTEPTDNPFSREAYPQGTPPQKFWNSDFAKTGDSTNRSVVVIGSSMLATHNQENNGEMCHIGTAARPETRFDGRGMPGNDFYASPGYRVPWTRAWAGARTGFDSGSVANAGVGTTDACGTAWGFGQSPKDQGLAWLAGKPNPLMITDGGLINDLKSSTGAWSDILKGLVTCQAMDMAVPAINSLLMTAWRDENGWYLSKDKSQIKIKGVWRTAIPPEMRLDKTLKNGVWTDALDVPQGQALARCTFVVKSPGNGVVDIAKVVRKTMNSLRSVDIEIPAVQPLAGNVAGNLAAIHDAYRPTVKQVWLQYPHMDSARVTIAVKDIAIFKGGVIAREFVEALGIEQTITLDVVERQLRPRVAQVSDDLNRVMYNAIGCAANGPYVVGHGPMVCEKDGDEPMVAITRDDYPGWGFMHHQSTVIGGMPHESAAGADILGQGLIEADSLTVLDAP
jgi:hypothetical protein